MVCDQTGRSGTLVDNKEVVLNDGCVLHFCPRVPRLPQEDSYEDYHAFKFSLHSKSLQLQPSACIPSEPPPILSASGSLDRHPHQSVLQFVAASTFIGGLMGTRGSTIHRICHETSSSIHVSKPRVYHPDVTTESGRIIQCSASSPADLRRSALATLQALFATVPFSGPRSLYVVIPTELEGVFLAGGSKFLAQLQTKCQGQLYLRSPHPATPFERLLACKGHLPAFEALIPLLLSVLPQPLLYQSCAFPVAQDLQFLGNAVDLPLDTVVRRTKRGASPPPGFVPKRSKTWQRRRGS